MMSPILIPSLRTALLTLAWVACAQAQSFSPSTPAAPAAASVHAAEGIDWHRDDVDAAFQEAKASGKPIFIYWGAVWCPPCNQVKATIFNRQDFIERSHFFIPVYIDGDSPNAQKLGARFNVSGYPTMILLTANGEEIVRLPGEVDAERYLQLLETGMNGGKPVSTTLQAALAGHALLSQQDWRLLAYYSWETDEQQLVPKDRVVPTLVTLAQHCPAADRDLAARLLITAASLDAAQSQPTLSAAQRAQARAELERLLADPVLARQNFDLLTGEDGALAGYLTGAGSPARQALERSWAMELDRLADDRSLSNTDRLSALSSKISLARLRTPKGPLDDALVQQVLAQSQQLDQATSSAYERQSVISAAADNLADVGLMKASNELLLAELNRSHAPYYFMLDLARNARKDGDTQGALNWYRQAYERAEGPATRLQWGATYVRALLELSPEDDSRIVAAANQVLGELASTPNAFYERNLHTLQRMQTALNKWQANHQHASAWALIEERFKGVCDALPSTDAQRPSCEQLLNNQGQPATSA